MVKRGEVWLIRLEPTEGSEIRKTRPCVVVSPPDLSPYGIFVVVPMTTGARPAPFRPIVEFEGRVGFALPEQVRTVARSRLVRCLGEIDAATLSNILATLRLMFED